MDGQEAGIPSSEDRRVRVNAEDDCSTKTYLKSWSGNNALPLIICFLNDEVVKPARFAVI